MSLKFGIDIVYKLQLVLMKLAVRSMYTVYCIEYIDRVQKSTLVIILGETSHQVAKIKIK